MTDDLINAIEFLTPYAETIMELRDKLAALKSVEMDTEASQRALSKAKADLKSTTEARIASEKGIQNVKQAEVESQARLEKAQTEVNDRAKKIVAPSSFFFRNFSAMRSTALTRNPDSTPDGS